MCSYYSLIMLPRDPAKREKISYTLLRVVYKIIELDKKIRRYGTEAELYESEIHMIKSVKERSGEHVSSLAQAMGVTKGAVSQTLKKLERKGMIEKERDATNRTRLVPRLTRAGETAYAHHEQLHREFDTLVNALLENEPEENRTFLKGFLHSLEERLDAFEGE
jgi:DNA-binding MarR family transcriptional regulator